MPAEKTLKIPQTLYRIASFDRAAINEDERTVELSISSEEPYERYFGIEILDHAPGSVDMSRMKAGAPLLFNHDRNAHLGRIIAARLDNGRLRITAKFSKSKFAEEKWQDVRDGILREASVGYAVEKMTLEKEEDGVSTYRVNAWEPFEGSLVTVPADATVGVGRSADAEKEISLTLKIKVDETIEPPEKRETQIPAMPSETQPIATTAEPKIEITRERAEAVSAERKRVADIQELSRHFAEKGLGGRKIDTSKLAGECIAEGKSARDFQDAVVRGAFDEVKPIVVPEVGMSEKEKKEYSLLRAMRTRALGVFDGLEKAAHEAHAKLIGKEPEGGGFYIPQDVMNGRAFPNGISPQQVRALFAGAYAAAGALVADDISAFSLIELLRNQMFTVQMGALTLSGLRGNVPIPRQTGGATASWLAEDATISETNQTVGQLNLSPHRLGARTSYTQQLLAQSSIDVENFVRQDLMSVIAIARDLAALHGTGVSGQPVGITNTTGVATVQLASADSLTYAKAVAFETTLAQSNAIAGRLGFITSPQARANAKQLSRFANTDTPVWTPENLVNGYPAVATNQIASPGVLFGNFADLILADWAETSVIVDPYTSAAAGQIRIIMQLMCDNGIRHAQSFAKAVL